MKASLYPEDLSPTLDDLMLSVDIGGTNSTKTIKLQTLARLINQLDKPVGSLYFSTVSTNPSTTLGFGTWVAYAQGAAIAGVAPSGTFSVPNVVIGEEQHTLTTTEMPAHSHGVNDPGHNHSSANGQQIAIAASSTNHLTLSGTAQQITWGNTSTSSNGTGVWLNNAGGDGAHNNIQPTIPVYIWQRTA